MLQEIGASKIHITDELGIHKDTKKHKEYRLTRPRRVDDGTLALQINYPTSPLYLMVDDNYRLTHRNLFYGTIIINKF